MSQPPPVGNAIGSLVFAQLTRVTNTQLHRCATSLAIGRISYTPNTIRPSDSSILVVLCCAVLIQKIKDGQAPYYRPELKDIDSSMHPGVSTLMKQCWAEEPSQRPLFDEVAKTLRTINKGKLVPYS